MPEDAGAKPADEVGPDGHAGQVSLPQPVHHPHVNTQKARETDADGREDADVLRSDDAALKKLRDQGQRGSHRSEGGDRKRDGFGVGEPEEWFDDE